MPFKKLDVKKHIEETLSADPELKRMWNESRTEYRILGELIRLRKEKGLSQVELAERSGNKQQVISRIEKKENSPTLKTICSLLDALEYDIQFVPRSNGIHETVVV